MENRYDTNHMIEENYIRTRRKRKRTISTFFVMFGFVIVLVLVTLLAGITLKWIKPGTREADMEVVAEVETVQDVETVQEPITYTQEELDLKMEEAANAARTEASEDILNGIKETLSTGDTTMVETLRPYYQNDLVVVSNGKFHFVPIQESLKKHNHTEEQLLVLESGEHQYVQEGQVISYKGIDVSKFQGNIDWQAVAADGVEFAFIRVGNRGYGSAGKLLEDEYFEENIEGALQAGIKVGVYFYTQAINEEELLEEAKLVLEKIAPYKIECPVVYDVEKVSSDNGRMNMLSVEERTHLTKLFCDTIADAGYKPMVYYNMEMAALMLDIAQLEEYDKWFAYYNSDFYYPYAYKIWQYTHNGHVNGIKGDVDMNIAFEPIWE